MGRSRSPPVRRLRTSPPRRRRSRSPPRSARVRRRSRSPRRPRSRSPLRRRYSRSRSRSPNYRRERYRRSPSRDRKSPENNVQSAPTKAEVPIGDNLSEEQMMAAMGLPTTLSTTKGKQVPGQMSGVRIPSKRQYRQYMNRLGGFNRPLSKTF